MILLSAICGLNLKKSIAIRICTFLLQIASVENKIKC